MAIVEELIRIEEDNSLSFGNYFLERKTKVEEFEYEGDSYKVKTFREITKLEKNGLFVYESVPGSAVLHFKREENKVSFDVEAEEDIQITLELEPEKEYTILIDKVNVGQMKTNLGGKLVISTELDAGKKSHIEVIEA